MSVSSDISHFFVLEAFEILLAVFKYTVNYCSDKIFKNSNDAYNGLFFSIIKNMFNLFLLDYVEFALELGLWEFWDTVTVKFGNSCTCEMEVNQLLCSRPSVLGKWQGKGRLCQQWNLRFHKWRLCFSNNIVVTNIIRSSPLKESLMNTF